jgi:pimeloyl-ACP methyl ester carboxylesterase
MIDQVFLRRLVRGLAAASALAMAMACTACSRATSSAESAATSATLPAIVSQKPAEFVAGPCPTTPKPVALLQRARCGMLVVAEDRTKPDGRTLHLAVAIVSARTQPAAADPVVLLQGGPGVDGVMYPPVPAGIDRNRDLILISPRGNWLSQPAMICPEITEFEIRRVGMVYDAPSTGDEQERAAKACRDRLAVGADLSAFNTVETAYDLVELRRALGIKQWNVFSVSYGTDLALTYMRLDPDAIRSVVLDGVTPPSAASPGWTWSSVREAFDNMTQACVAQPACNARYPNLAQTFIDQVRKLEANPVATIVTLPQVGDVRVVLDGGALLDWFANTATKSPAGFPDSVDQLARGNPRPIVEQVATKADPAQAVRVAEGQPINVFCREWVPYESRDEELRLAEQAFPEFPDSVRAQAPQLPFIRQECKAWNVPKAPAAVRAVTVSSIATLVLSGAYDAQTGPQWGSYVAKDLSRSTVVTVPGWPHGVYHQPCAAKVIVSFFDNPARPDIGCVASIRPPTYSIRALP